MNQKALHRSTAIVRRKKDEKINARREKGRLAEVAGGSAADCTAVCCCCPWTVLNVVIFAVYRIPAALCRKAMNKKKHRRRMKNKYLIQQQQQQRKAVTSRDFTDGPVGPAVESFEAHVPDVADGDDLKKLEEEMWTRFNQTGFWRSSSQRHE